MKNKDKYDLRQISFVKGYRQIKSVYRIPLTERFQKISRKENIYTVYYNPKHVPSEEAIKNRIVLAELPRDGRERREIFGEWLESEC